jgi:putative ABC transport system substrate-binding protein
MRRRKFISLLGGAAVVWSRAARAQQQAAMPVVGFLGANTSATTGHLVTGFVQRLQEHGWIQGRSIAFEYRWAEGHEDHLSAFAAEFVRRNVAVVVAQGTSAAVAIKQATSKIPIVFIAADPLGSGLIPNLARPGGNVTGLSMQSSDSNSKIIELLGEVVPSLRRLAIMTNGGNPAIVAELAEVQAAARRLGLEIASFEVRQAGDFAPAFEALKGRTDGLYVAPDVLMMANRTRVNILALRARMPTIYNFREFVEAGGLMSYGPNFQDLFRRAADLVDNILHGAKPGDIPVEQPIKFDLVINLTTAKALGLTIPESFLLRANEVIE